jgi:hypothetical protein
MTSMNRTVRVSSEPFSDSRQRQALPSCTARRAYPTESLERELNIITAGSRPTAHSQPLS